MGAMPSTNDYSLKEKKFLLGIARKSIEYYLENGKIMNVEPKDIPSKKLVEDRACFVSLHTKKNHELRGCIGMLEATRPLILDVVNNAVSAARDDPRFRSVSSEELKNIEISISVLTKPVEVEVKDEKDLLKKLVPKKHGLIIQKGYNRATFLPVVWEELKTKEEFLSHLCMKAGLMADEWKKLGMKFFFYEAVEFEE